MALWLHLQALVRSLGTSFLMVCNINSGRSDCFLYSCIYKANSEVKQTKLCYLSFLKKKKKERVYYYIQKKI